MKKYIVIVIIFSVAIGYLKAEEDSLAVVRAWKLSEDFSSIIPVDVDTNLTNFQLFYPNYIESKSNAFLGNIGTPNISNIFSDRIYSEEPFFLNNYLSYFHTAENTEYYNTRKPFSRLTYTNGNPKNDREETFEAFITENIGPRFNFALRYHIISSKGQYKYGGMTKNSFRLSSNYTGQRYIMHSSFNVNRNLANENGGIDDEAFETGSYEFLRGLPTNIGGTEVNAREISYARNHIRHFDFMVSQRLKLFTLASKVDTTQPAQKRNVAEPVLTYVVRAKRATKRYTHTNHLESGLYDFAYFNPSETYDSLANFRLTNSLKLEFKTTFRGKVQVGLYASIANDFDKNHFTSKWDTSYVPGDTILTFTPIIDTEGDTLKGVSTGDQFSSTYFTAGLYGSFWNKVKTSFDGKVYFLGYKSGQTEFKGLLNTDITILKKELLFDVSAKLKNKVPDYLLRNYYSNHFIWEDEQQNLNSEIWTNLSGKLSAPSNNFDVTANYYLISNLIYFNQDAKPQNFGNAVNVLSFGVEKTFKLWKLNSVNKVVYQISENPEVLAIPNLVFYNSTYFHHIFRFESTGGDLETILGFDFFYTTQYNGYEYSPALSQFYTQEDIMIGNYPLMDAFLNIKLKRVRFFFKLQHFNSRWFGQNYYSTVHYPHNQVMDKNQLVFKFGLSWVFYD